MQSLRLSARGRFYMFYKDQEELNKFSKDDVTSIQQKIPLSTKQKSAYYPTLNGRNPDAIFNCGGLNITNGADVNYLFFGNYK